MPFVSQLRKEMLQALDDFIIPALKTTVIPLGYIDTTLQVPKGISTTLISRKVLSTSKTTPGNWPIKHRWPEQNILTKECPCLGFIYQGFADERIALIKEDPISNTDKTRLLKGIYALHLPAPSVVYITPGTPHLDGEKVFWESAIPEEAYSRILYLRILPTNVLAHLCRTQGGKHISAHVLQTHDQALALIAQLFSEELQKTPVINQEVASALLLAMMQALRKNLLSNNVQLTNSAWPYLPTIDTGQRQISSRLRELCGHATQYIQINLHEKLTLEQIARHAQITPQHLNWAFRQVLGTTVMRYVTLQRVEAAKLMLSGKAEYIQDVAQLVGFERFSTFCSVFRRETQMSPSEYRRYSKQKA